MSPLAMENLKMMRKNYLGYHDANIYILVFQGEIYL